MTARSSDDATFTIAVCTRNRAQLLRDCLESLAREEDETSFPVLVVDNASTDETREVGASFAARLDLRIVVERRIGLSHARNRAIRECRTEYVVYLDDDARILPGWVSAVREGIRKWAPDVFGGPHRPFYVSPKPAWFDDEFVSALRSEPEGPLPEDVFLTGGNSGWRLDLLESLGGFPVDLGMRGESLGIGEEIHVQALIRQRVPPAKIVLLPRMDMEHRVEPAKLSIRYHLKRSWIAGKTSERTFGREPSPLRPVRLTRSLASFSLSLGRCLIRDRARHPHWKSFVAHEVAPRVAVLGYHANTMSNTFNRTQ